LDRRPPGAGRGDRGAEGTCDGEPGPGRVGGGARSRVNLSPLPSVLGPGAGALTRVRANDATNSRRRRGRRQGAALILTLLVLAILVVFVVQLTFSVKVEETIVRNMEDDTAMELAAVRGGIPLLAALFRDDRKNGNPAGEQD